MMKLTLLVHIVDFGEVVHVSQEHCGFDNCMTQKVHLRFGILSIYAAQTLK